MFNLLNNCTKTRHRQEKHKDKNQKHEYPILDLNHLNANTQLQIQPYYQWPTKKKTDKKIIKQILQLAQNKLVIKNEKRKKPSKRHKGDYQNKKFKHNDRKA